MSADPQPRYKALRLSEAKDKGLGAPDFEPWEYMNTDDGWRSGIWDFSVKPAACVGTDGGEPEDQTLRRDWSWVVDALNTAYAAGYADGAKS